MSNKVKWFIRSESEYNDQSYTITQNPKISGWNTDSGCEGYGLPKDLAQWICDILNEYGKDCPYLTEKYFWKKNEE